MATARRGVFKRGTEVPKVARKLNERVSKADLLEVAWSLAGCDDENATLARLVEELNLFRERRGAPKLVLTLYTVRCDGAEETFSALDLDTACVWAGRWVRAASWGEAKHTFWVRAWVIGGGAETQVTVAIDPPEPECSHDEHDWQSPYAILGGLQENPGVWGHGGGVIIHEVCMHCGTERVTDTWAQDRDTGEQGLRSVSYERGKYADEVRALAEDNDNIEAQS